MMIGMAAQTKVTKTDTNAFIGADGSRSPLIPPQ